MLDWVVDHPFTTGLSLVTAVLVAASFWGPLVPYRYRRKIIINASREDVWRAVDMFALDAQSVHPGWQFTRMGASRVLSEPVDGQTGNANEYELVERVDGERLTYRLSRTFEKSGAIKEAPYGTDSFETLEVKDAWTDYTWLHYSARFRFRTPLEALLFRGAITRMLKLDRRYCETGERRANLPPNLLKSVLFFALALVGAVIMFGPVTGVMILTMLLLHEIGHAVALKLVGEKVHGIHFIPFLGAVTQGSPPKTALRHAIFSLGGVMFSFPLLVALILMPAWLGFAVGPESYSEASLDELSIASIFYGFALCGIILNAMQLLPVPFLDGGQTIQAMLSGFNRRAVILLLALFGVATSVGLFVLTFHAFAVLALALTFLSLHLLKATATHSFEPANGTTALGIFGIYASQIGLYIAAGAFLFATAMPAMEDLRLRLIETGYIAREDSPDEPTDSEPV